MKMFATRLAACAALLMLGACSFAETHNALLRQDAQIAEKTPTQTLLEKLPAAQQPVVLSVYEFQDQTGAQKPNDNYADFSRAVTQGGVSMLYKALLDAGKGSWFTVIERAGLKNLLQERQLIRATREQYATANGQKLSDVDPLLYAGVILEGGIVAYDSNVLTGGAGAGYLGISANAQYRRDMVTIYLRAISVQNGEVLASVNTSKTIYSTVVTANIFKYVSFDEILEAETGYSVNEPPQLAVRQAVEYGVYSLVMEGAIKGLWGFANPSSAKEQLRKYMNARDGAMPKETELNRILGVTSNSPVMPRDEPRESGDGAPMVPTREIRTLPDSRYDRTGRGEGRGEGASVRQPQNGATGGNVYAAPKAPAQPGVKQAQMPADTTYVPPAPGQKPEEDKVNAQPVVPQPQLFNSQSGGPVYDVVCTAQGCFPSTSGASATSAPPGTGR